MNPPEAKAVNNSLETLRYLQALDPDREDRLTPLGYHLASLPVDPRIGKMLLLGAVFRCLNPVLTIAAALAYRPPFVAPLEKRDEADKAKRSLRVVRHLISLVPVAIQPPLLRFFFITSYLLSFWFRLSRTISPSPRPLMAGCKRGSWEMLWNGTTHRRNSCLATLSACWKSCATSSSSISVPLGLSTPSLLTVSQQRLACPCGEVDQGRDKETGEAPSPTPSTTPSLTISS